MVPFKPYRYNTCRALLIFDLMILPVKAFPVKYVCKGGLCNDSTNVFVLKFKVGKRMVDNFFPAEVMRVGLPQLLYAFSVLGAGNAPELSEAWELLESKKDVEGRYILEGTLAKSYLPKEKVNKPSKWVTLYDMLAEKYRELTNI